VAVPGPARERNPPGFADQGFKARVVDHQAYRL
jgi:hypothetical protein